MAGGSAGGAARRPPCVVLPASTAARFDGDPDNTFSFSAEEWENDPSLVWSFQSNCYVGGVT